MTELDMENLRTILKEAKATQENELMNCIDKCESITLDKTTCEFFLIKCTRDKIREEAFLGAIRGLLVLYALRKDEYEKIDKRNAWDMVDLAKRRFLHGPKSGEVGELILFALLESQRDAPQLVNKMSLKTDGNMHVFGLDGIHIGVLDDELRIYYGESKFRKSLTDSVKKATGDLKVFDADPKEEWFEITLVNNFIDFSKFGEHIDDIKEILNPYADDKSFLRYVYAVFIGFDWESIEKLDFSKISDGIQELLEECLMRNSQSILEACSKEVKNLEIENTVEFFLIPFRSVDRFRQSFLEMIE